MTKIDPETIKDYMETEYRVLGDNCCVLRVGSFSVELKEMHRAKGVACSAFITACNPFSRILDTQENDARMGALTKELVRQGTEFLAGIGQHPSNAWPGEESLLIFGIGLEAAKDLGQRLGQNGIIWSDADAVPTLILLR